MKDFLIIKIVFLLVFTCISQTTFCQEYCDVLRYLFEDKYIKNHVYIRNYIDRPLIVVDTNNSLKNCNDFCMFGRDIKIRKTFKKDSMYIRRNDVFFTFEHLHDTLKVFIAYPSANRFGYVLCKKKQDDYKIIYWNLFVY